MEKNDKKSANAIKIPLDLSDSKIICQCAESSIFLRPNLSELLIEIPVILKLRHAKRYRIPEIEESLSKARMKQEIANMKKAKKLKLNVPEIYHADFENKAIYMEYLQYHMTLKNLLKSATEESQSIFQVNSLLGKCGEFCGVLHNEGLIHGDLTSSNIMVHQENESVYFIDFGLSFVSGNIEDKAVDLYVFEKSLLCEDSSEKMLGVLLESFFGGYSKVSNNFEQIFVRLQKVKARGRKKVAFG